MPDGFTINNGTLYIIPDDGDAVPLGNFVVEGQIDGGDPYTEFNLGYDVDYMDHVMLHQYAPQAAVNDDDVDEPIEQQFKLLDDFLNGFMITDDDIRR